MSALLCCTFLHGLWILSARHTDRFSQRKKPAACFVLRGTLHFQSFGMPTGKDPTAQVLCPDKIAMSSKTRIDALINIDTSVALSIHPAGRCFFITSVSSGGRPD